MQLSFSKYTWKQEKLEFPQIMAGQSYLKLQWDWLELNQKMNNKYTDKVLWKITRKY